MQNQKSPLSLLVSHENLASFDTDDAKSIVESVFSAPFNLYFFLQSIEIQEQKLKTLNQSPVKSKESLDEQSQLQKNLSTLRMGATLNPETRSLFVQAAMGFYYYYQCYHHFSTINGNLPKPAELVTYDQTSIDQSTEASHTKLFIRSETPPPSGEGTDEEEAPADQAIELELGSQLFMIYGIPGPQSFKKDNPDPGKVSAMKFYSDEKIKTAFDHLLTSINNWELSLLLSQIVPSLSLETYDSIMQGEMTIELLQQSLAKQNLQLPLSHSDLQLVNEIQIALGQMLSLLGTAKLTHSMGNQTEMDANRELYKQQADRLLQKIGKRLAPMHLALAEKGVVTRKDLSPGSKEREQAWNELPGALDKQIHRYQQECLHAFRSLGLQLVSTPTPPIRSNTVLGKIVELAKETWGNQESSLRMLLGKIQERNMEEAQKQPEKPLGVESSDTKF